MPPSPSHISRQSRKARCSRECSAMFHCLSNSSAQWGERVRPLRLHHHGSRRNLAGLLRSGARPLLQPGRRAGGAGTGAWAFPAHADRERHGAAHRGRVSGVGGAGGHANRGRFTEPFSSAPQPVDPLLRRECRTCAWGLRYAWGAWRREVVPIAQAHLDGGPVIRSDAQRVLQMLKASDRIRS